MPFCTSCGHENATEARFCNGCGQRMPTAPTAAPERPISPPQQTIYDQRQQQESAPANPPPPPDNVIRQTPIYNQQPPPQQPAYQQQQGYPQPYRSRKDKTTATLLAWLFWPAYDFYLGNSGKAVAKLLTFGGLGVWALIDAIKILSMSQQEFDWRYNS